MLRFRLNLPTKSLKTKFIVISGSIFLTIFVLASSILISQSVDFQKQALASKARSYSNLATKPIGDAYNSYYQAGYLKFREDLLDLLSFNKDITRIQIISVEGLILFNSVDLPTSIQTPLQSIKDEAIFTAVSSNQTTEIKLDNGDIKEIIVPFSDSFNSRPFSIRYFVSYESIYGKLNQIIFTTIFITLILLLITSISINFLVNKSILSPLEKIINSAKRISGGSLNEKIELNTKDELSDLANSLNQMMLSLKKDIQQLKELDHLKDEFVVLASHNLRTPLTIIKGYLTLLERNKKLTQEEVKALKGIASGTKSLDVIVETLLNMVSIETDKETTKKETADVQKLVFEIEKELSDKAKEKNVTISLDQENTNSILVEGDEKRIKQAIEAVVDNAIKFNKEKGIVSIKTKIEKNQVLISIKDQGEGISSEAEKRVFTKFNRARDSLTNNSEGLGIGLYLAKLVIESHKGRIWFDSTQQGTTFYITLPIKEEHSGDL